MANKSSWWTVTLDKVTYGDTVIGGGNQPGGAPKSAILDTGTSLLSLTQSDYLQFVDQIL